MSTLSALEEKFYDEKERRVRDILNLPAEQIIDKVWPYISDESEWWTITLYAYMEKWKSYFDLYEQGYGGALNPDKSPKTIEKLLSPAAEITYKGRRISYHFNPGDVHKILRIVGAGSQYGIQNAKLDKPVPFNRDREVTLGIAIANALHTKMQDQAEKLIKWVMKTAIYDDELVAIARLQHPA